MLFAEEIQGWIAITKHGVILSSFRQNKAQTAKIARQRLRLLRCLLDNQHDVGTCRLVRATLVIHKDAASSESENKQS